MCINRTFKRSYDTIFFMNKKSLLLLLTFAISCCTSLNKLDYYKEVDLSSIVSIGDKLSVTLNSGDNYYLKVVSIKENQMVGTLLETSEGITITVEDIEYIEVETIDGSKTTLAIMGGIVLIPFGILGLMFGTADAISRGS